MKVIGVDLGGTKTLSVLVEDEQVVDKVKARTPRTGGPDDVIVTIVDTVRRLAGADEAEVIGIGVPGPVRAGTGILPAAPNLPGWDHDVDVAAALSHALDGRPVVVDNDVNVATLAEHRRGSAVGHDDVLGVYAGTGIGAGLVLDGRLRRGPHGSAGELGHSFVAFAEFDDDEPGRGETEDHAGRRALERKARAADTEGRPTLLVDLAGDATMKSRVWAEAVEAADPVAVELVDRAASALATAMANVIAIVDVEMIVLGGGLAERLGEPFRRRIEDELGRRAFAGVTAPVRSASLGSTGGALGAAIVAADQLAGTGGGP